MKVGAKALLLIGLGVLGVYVIPTAVARYSGSHTWEVNSTDGVASVNCVNCHGYILNELNSTAATETVLNAHTDAAGNSSFTQNWLNLTIDNTTQQGVCQLCHINQLSSTVSHTKVTIRACTDQDCHGDNSSTNNTAYPEGRMGPYLGGTNTSDPTNVHMRIFNQISDFDSGYRNETSVDYKEGFFFCIGCHTTTEFEITRQGTEELNHSDFNEPKRRYL
jgi:hypothetical protein